KEESANERIDLSGKLRMLSQRIPSAACHMAAGIDPEGAAKQLDASVVEFEKILGALEFGDADLNVQLPEERRKTIAKIHETREAWAPFKAAAIAIAAGDNSGDDLQIILSQNLSLLSSAQSLVSEMIEQYSTSPSTTQADLFLVDIAGRQRMLTQKMSKESCTIVSGVGNGDSVKDLQGTMQMFEVSLEALRFGMPALGIRKPPTPEISEGLGDVLSEWKALKPSLEAVLSDAKLDKAAASEKFNALNSTMATMNAVVGLYVEASKHKG
ncbi:unnamed protein product, partial [Ectocarpus sp. 12 AP-2014]